MSRKMPCKTIPMVFAACVAATAAAHATENDQTHIDLAYIDVLAGITLPEGLYIRYDIDYNVSDRLNDRNGNPTRINAGPLGSSPLKFYSSNVADVISVIYSSNITLLGAKLGVGVYGFYAWSRAEGQSTFFGHTTGSGESRRGLGDSTVVPVFFQWVIPSHDLYVILSPVEFTAPTGQYNRNDPIGNTIGLNDWSYRPALELTYLNDGGQEVSANINFSINSENTATSYRSGDEFSVTYVVEQHVSRALAAGLEGYFYDQVTDDTQDGLVVNTVRPPSPFIPFDPEGEGPGNRGEVFAIGPTASYNPTPRLATNFHWVHEVFSDNRKQGDSFWLRAAYHF